MLSSSFKSQNLFNKTHSSTLSSLKAYLQLLAHDTAMLMLLAIHQRFFVHPTPTFLYRPYFPTCDSNSLNSNINYKITWMSQHAIVGVPRVIEDGYRHANMKRAVLKNMAFILITSQRSLAVNLTSRSTFSSVLYFDPIASPFSFSIHPQMAHTDNHPPQGTGTQEIRISWYNKSIGSKLGEPARHLLETYSNIPADEVEKHVYAIVSLTILLFQQTIH
jgi:hypothetical protein